jgi:hypothetical protein
VLLVGLVGNSDITPFSGYVRLARQPPRIRFILDYQLFPIPPWGCSTRRIAALRVAIYALHALQTLFFIPPLRECQAKRFPVGGVIVHLFHQRKSSRSASPNFFAITDTTIRRPFIGLIFFVDGPPSH